MSKLTSKDLDAFNKIVKILLELEEEKKDSVIMAVCKILSLDISES